MSYKLYVPVHVYVYVHVYTCITLGHAYIHMNIRKYNKPVYVDIYLLIVSAQCTTRMVCCVEFWHFWRRRAFLGLRFRIQ